jgi:hypothetical protein
LRLQPFEQRFQVLSPLMTPWLDSSIMTARDGRNHKP